MHDELSLPQYVSTSLICKLIHCRYFRGAKKRVMLIIFPFVFFLAHYREKRITPKLEYRHFRQLYRGKSADTRHPIVMIYRVVRRHQRQLMQ